MKTFEHLEDLFVQYLHGELNLRPGTIKAYRYDLGRFKAFLVAQDALQDDFGGPNDRHIIRQFLAERSAPGRLGARSGAYTARGLAILKAFYGFLVREKLLAEDPTEGFKFPKVTRKDPGCLSEEESGRVLRVIGRMAGPWAEARDRAIWTTLFGAGLRVSELVGIDVRHVDLTEKRIEVLRKGGSTQRLEISEMVQEALTAYLRWKSRNGSVEPASPMFVSRLGGRISTGDVRYLIKVYSRAAQIDRIKVTPHVLRHSFATIALRRGADPKTVSDLMGHKGLQTISRYLHSDEQTRRAAVNSITAD